MNRTHPVPVEAGESERILVPEHARSRALDELPLPAFMRVFLRTMGCHRLGDLHGMPYARFESYQTWGPQAVADLKRFVDGLSGFEAPFEGEQPGLPPEVAALPIQWAPISVQLEKALVELGCRTFGDAAARQTRDLAILADWSEPTRDGYRRLVDRIQSGEFAAVRDPLGAAGIRQTLRSLDARLIALPAREWQFVLLRFGGTDCGPLAPREIAAEQNLTGKDVIRLVARALVRIRRRGGPDLGQRLHSLLDACTGDVFPLTPAFFADRFGPEPPMLAHTIAFYIRLVEALVPGIPAWPEGQRYAGEARGRSSTILDAIHDVLRKRRKSIRLKTAFETLRSLDALGDLTPFEFVDAFMRQNAPAVDFAAPARPRARVETLGAVTGRARPAVQSPPPSAPDRSRSVAIDTNAAIERACKAMVALGVARTRESAARMLLATAAKRFLSTKGS